MGDGLVISAPISTVQLEEHRLRYLFRFNKIVKELRDQVKDLTLARSTVQEYVKEARSHTQTQRIEKYALDWLTEADNVLNEVQTLERRIEENKRCFCWCPNWIWRYQLSKEIEEKILAVRQLVTSSAFNVMQFFESKSSNKAFKEIMEALKDAGVNMIGVWGMAGVGKTTLVDAVINKVKEVKIFHKVIKVVVSQLPDIGKIQDNIADSLDLKFETMTQEGKAEELRLQLENEGKVLIILDDLWNKLDLKGIGIPFDNIPQSCKIILTTRNRTVCKSMRSQVMVSLSVMDEDEAWTLFRMNASLDHASQEIIDLAKGVASECGGLPLAIVQMARASRIKDDLDGSGFENIENIIQTELEKIVYPRIEKSYDHLRSETTKRCLVLCAIYPYEDSIHVEDLVRYAWCLELYKNANSVEDVRSQVYKAINELKVSCLLFEADQKRFIMMHNVVRDASKWIASKEDNGLVIKTNEDGSENESSKQKLKILVDDNYYNNRDEDFEWMRELKVLSLIRTRSYGQDVLFSLNALKSLTNLRTLQLEGFKHLEDISALEMLKQLEILNLRNSDIRGPVDILGRLENLRVLDIRECEFLLRFPSNVIRRLVNLEELYLYHSTTERLESGVTTEEESITINTDIVQELKSLPKLASLLLEVPLLHFSEDLVFPRVRRYRIAINKCFETDPMTISSRFLAISKIFSLNVIWELLENVEFLQVSNIMGSDIECLIDASPGNVPVARNLQNLKHVIIEKCGNLQVIFQMKKEENQASLLLNLEDLCVSELPVLEYIWKIPAQHISLRSLKVVKIVKCGKLKSLFTFSVARSLKCLEELEISYCGQLKQVVEEPDQGYREQNLRLPKLRSLEISDCQWLEYIFPKLMAPQGLPQLQKLKLSHLGMLKQICAPAKEREETGILFPQLQLFQSLTVLRVEDCPRLTNVNIHSEASGATLKDIYISGVETQFYEEIIQLRGGYFLSSVEKLTLKNQLTLQFVWNDPSQIVTLHYLSHLEVSGCRKLRNIFSGVVARNLPQLRYLKVIGCHQLEHVIVEDRISPSMAGQIPVYFPNLEEIRLTDCIRLKSLFPVTARLPKLKILGIRSAPNLREIFQHDIVAKKTHDKKLNETLLPKLQALVLQDVPNLTRFTTACYCLAFPDLSCIRISRCPISMKFSAVRDDSRGSYVRAEMEKPELPEETNVGSSIKVENITVDDKKIKWGTRPYGFSDSDDFFKE